MLEQVLYETRPFVFLATALAAHLYAPNALTNVFAFVLAGCMGMVIYWRYENRFLNVSPARRKQRRR
jgi:hypothetical protein